MDFDGLLKAVFGSSKPEDLATPIFVAAVAVMALVFWAAAARGKRRRRKMIDDYDAKLAAHSAQLRRNGAQSRIRR
jgi:hypothetical protein